MNTLDLIEQKILLVDCQTTGTRAGHDRLLEIAWTWTSALDSFPPEVHSILLHLPDELPRRVQEITGITAAEVAEGEDPAKAWRSFHEALTEKNTFALAHYAQFEKPFLEKFYAEHGGGTSFPYPLLCSYRIAKRLFPESPSRNIRGLAGYFGSELGEIRRARDHVLATAVIWQRVATQLHSVGVRDVAALTAWLQAKEPGKKKASTNFRVDRLKRLRLPESPGIYRMLAKNGEILYVGKASSLRSRVNSYFRGGCANDRRKLEMLARVWDIEVVECASPLEAALLENDEIKKHLPHYNRALRPSGRPLVYYSRDFRSISLLQDEQHPFGAFREQSALQQVCDLVLGLTGGELKPVFYEPVAEQLLREGFAIFRGEIGLDPDAIPSVRQLLALGMRSLRLAELTAEVEEEQESEEPSEEVEEQPEDIAAKFHGLMARAADEYRRSKKLGRLLNAAIEWESEGKWRSLRVVNGVIHTGEVAEAARDYPWAGLTAADYDRMVVLQSELNRRPHRVQAHKRGQV